MSEKIRKGWPVYREVREGYQPTVDKPLHHPPKGGSNVMPPPKSQEISALSQKIEALSQKIENSIQSKE